MTSIQLVSENEFNSAPHNTELTSFITLVGLRAPAFVPDEVRERAGMDIIAVLDRSGSMAGSKMEMLHTTVNLMIDHLKDSDRLSLVAYDDQAEVHTQLTRMDKKGKELSKAALKQIRDRGMTNLSGGLFTGLQILKDRVEGKNEVSSVLLLTDGLANHGITDPVQLVNETQTFLASMNNPTSIYTFGFGSDHNSELLTSIARAGHGTYYFMKDPDSVPPAFADCLGGLMSVIAQNIRLTVSAAEGVTIKNITTPFPKNEDAHHNHVISIGDLFSEEERDILVEIFIPAVSSPTSAQPLVHYNLRYTNVITASSETLQHTATIERTDAGTKVGQGSVKVDQQRNRLQTAAVMDEARRLGQQGQLDRARELLNVTAQQIHASPAAMLSADLVQDLNSVSAQMMDMRTFQAEGAHRLMNKSAKHAMQRACESDEREVQSYANASKGGMRSLWKK